MKTIYTDTYGLLPWAWLLLSIYWSVRAFDQGDRLGLALSLLAAVSFLVLALREVRRRAQARREGRDPSIIRTTDAPNQ